MKKIAKAPAGLLKPMTDAKLTAFLRGEISALTERERTVGDRYKQMLVARDARISDCERGLRKIKNEALEVAFMERALAECADDLEAEIKARYCTEPDGSCHPALVAKMERDLRPVVQARAAFAKNTSCEIISFVNRTIAGERV